MLCFAPLLPVLLLLQGAKENLAVGQDGNYLEKCCSLGGSWADQKLRCESFAGPVPGVSEAEQAACLETVDVCCRRSFQERSCEEGKASARAGLACGRAESAESAHRRTPAGLDRYRRDCCEGCKLGILIASSGKGCSFKTFNLGIPWEPAYVECCVQALSSTVRESASSSTPTTGASESYESPEPERNEADFDFDLGTTADPTEPIKTSGNLCELMKGLLCSEICVPTPGSYYCKCPEGSVLQQDGRSCKSNTTLTVTFNASNATASASGNARSTRSLPLEDNELNQSCPEGFRFSAESSTCDDVDECLENIHECIVELENCKNLEGSYVCEIKCEKGFIFNADYGTCFDVNECAEWRNICPQAGTVCINTQGSYECKELRDYQLGGAQGETRHASQVANRVASQVASQAARTDEGEQTGSVSLDEEDIDECRVHREPCAPGELCRNTQGGYDCIPAACPRGFRLAEGACRDVDECAEGVHACAPHERCQNTNGSFTCEQPRSTRAPYATERAGVQCRKGYKADAEKERCVDVDECLEGPGCRDHERCQNLPGTYDCSPLCDPGWFFHIPTKSCQDVDECLLGQHSCRQRTQHCRNTLGSYVCEPLSECPAGYRRAPDGGCADVDECREGLHACSRASYRYCVNLEGSYECITRLPSCPRGYEYSLLTRQCEDVDECRAATAARARCDSRFNERCVNLRGSYRCERPALDLRQQQRRRPACPEGLAYEPELRRCHQPEATSTPPAL